MSRTAKITYFFVALITMFFLAAASTLMAQGQAALATVFFIVAFIIIGVGFVVRKRLLRRS